MTWELLIFLLQVIAAFLAVVTVIAAVASLATWLFARGSPPTDASPFIDTVPALADGTTSSPGPPVTVASYGEPVEAHLDRILLESHDIPVFVADEGLIGANWFYSNAIGGAKLQVPEPYAEAASRLLADHGTVHPVPPSPSSVAPPAPAETSTQPTGDLCPACGSDRIYRVRWGRKIVYASLLFLGFPIPVTGHVRECAACGHRWG